MSMTNVMRTKEIKLMVRMSKMWTEVKIRKIKKIGEDKS